MRKRFLIILIICFVVILATLAYLFLSPSSPIENIANSNPNQEINGTRTPWKFPNITLPWSSKPSGSGGNGSSGSGSSGNGGSGSSNNTKSPVIKNNYTLFVNSTNNLEVLVIYTVNDVVFNETKSLPFSLDIQENTYACLAETTGSGTIRWLMEDGSDCPFSECSGGLYDCNILMDRSHSVTIRQYS